MSLGLCVRDVSLVEVRMGSMTQESDFEMIYLEVSVSDRAFGTFRVMYVAWGLRFLANFRLGALVMDITVCPLKVSNRICLLLSRVREPQFTIFRL